MNISHINNSLFKHKSVVMSSLFAALIIISILCFTFIYDDISKVLYAAIGVLSGIIIFFLLMMNPFFALILIVMLTELANLMPVQFIGSITKIIGIPVAIGWFLKYVMSKKTNLFKLMNYNKLLIIFIVSMICSSLLALNPSSSLSSLLKYTLSICMVFFIQDLIDSRDRLNIFIIAIASTVGISSLIGIIQFVIFKDSSTVYGNIHMGAESMIRIGGFGGANAFGVFLCSGLPFIIFLAFNAKKPLIKLLFSFLVFTTLICIGLTLSRTAIFGSAAVLLFYFLLNLKKIVQSKKQLLGWIFFILLLAFLLSNFLLDIIMQRDVTLHDGSSSERLNIFLKSLFVLKEYPFFGIGFNNISFVQNQTEFQTDLGRSGHDIFSVLFVSIGFIGTSVFLVLYYKTMTFYNATRRYLSRGKDDYLLNLVLALMAGFLSFLVLSAGDSPTNTRVFWFHLALASILNNFYFSSKPSFNKYH